MMDEARGILELCFPGARIRMLVVAGDSPKPHCIEWCGERHGLPNTVFRDGLAFVIDLVAPATGPDGGAEFPYVTARVHVPTEQEEGGAAVWTPRGHLRALTFLLNPILFEQLKYYHERAMLRRSRALPHLPVNRATPSFSPSPFKRSRPGGRPTIIMAMHWLDPGGAESFALWCIDRAVTLGFHVIVLCDHPPRDIRFSASVEFENVRWIRTDLFCDPELYGRLVCSLLDSIDVVGIHIHHSASMYNCLKEVVMRAHRPLIVDTTHIIEYENGGYPKLSGVWTKFVDHHHVISRALKSYYQDQVHRIGNVHLGYLVEPDRAPGDIRFSILEPKKTIRVGFVGRITHQKRPFLFLDVARRLIARARPGTVDYEFLVVGDGLFMAKTRELARRFHLGDTVQFLGHQSNVAELMAGLDLLVISSTNEGLTLVAFEAFRTGTLVLSSDVGAQSELIPPDLLLPAAPFQFCASATRRIERLVSDKAFARRQVDGFVERHAEIAKAPRAADVIGTLYTSMRGSPDTTVLSDS